MAISAIDDAPLYVCINLATHLRGNNYQENRMEIEDKAGLNNMTYNPGREDKGLYDASPKTSGKKRRWDAVLVGIVMVFAFSALMIKIVSYEISCTSWPVNIYKDLCLQGVDVVESQTSQVTGYLQNLFWQLSQVPQNIGLQ